MTCITPPISKCGVRVVAEKVAAAAAAAATAAGRRRADD